MNEAIGIIHRARKGAQDPFDYPATDYLHDTYDDHIEYISANGGVEIGPVNRMYHFHLMLSVVHWSRIMFDYYLMSNWFLDSFRGVHAMQEMNFKIFDQNGHAWVRDSEAWYTQLKLYPQDDWDEVLRRYVRKTAMSSTMAKGKASQPMNVSWDPAER